MDNIRKLQSGFYAMYHGENLWRADLVEWNGTRYLDNTGNWQEFPEKVVSCREFENWYQDSTGTVYIQYKNGTHCYMYSPGSVLYNHLVNMRRLVKREAKTA
jgi:hypothetical protein